MPEGDREAFAAAEKLVREAQERAERAANEATREVPPNGWAAAGAPPAPLPGPRRADRARRRAARAAPAELARQLADALRELLIAIRAVLDYTIEQLDRPPASEREVGIRIR